MFADDTTLSATGLTVDEIGTKLNRDLIKVNQWLIANKLTPSESKTEFIIIGLRQRAPSFEQGPLIRLGDKVTKRVPHKDTNNLSRTNIMRNKVKQFQRTLLC